MTSTQLRNLRLTYGLTQDDVASILGVTREMLSRWERGTYPLPHWITAALDLARSRNRRAERPRPTSPLHPDGRVRRPEEILRPMRADGHSHRVALLEINYLDRPWTRADDNDLIVGLDCNLDVDDLAMDVFRRPADLAARIRYLHTRGALPTFGHGRAVA